MRRRLLQLVVFAICALAVDASTPQRPAPSIGSTPSVVGYQFSDWVEARSIVAKQHRELSYLFSQSVSQPRAVKLKTGGSHRGYASAKECVSMVENHGDYGRSSNPTHFGRYQFSKGTWAAYGGNPDTWGTASPSEQDAVFETAWNSPGGPNNWLPYDGC